MAVRLVSVSGQIVKADIEVEVSSGLFVVSSSGDWIEAHILSGQVDISGQMVQVASGAYVVIQSGIYTIGGGGSGTYDASGVGVIIDSGVGVTIQSGVYLASGLYVTADIAESGIGVQVQSGIFLASGYFVVASSGDIVQISGQMIQVASGAVINISGETIILADAYIALSRAINLLNKPLWLDQTVGALRTQQLSGLVTITGGSVTATVATTIVNISGIVGFNPKDTWLNDGTKTAWCLNVRQRIT